MDFYKEWKQKSSSALLGGGNAAQQKQHIQGKKTARERLDLLIDNDSFEEIDQLAHSPFIKEPFYTDGAITGFATINERRVALYVQDFTIKGGSLGKRQSEKICKIMDMAAKIGCPIIGIIDSGGARINEGIHALAGYGDIFFRNVRYSGIIPQISIIVGPCAGGAVYSPALTDFIFATKDISQLFITGPQVIEQVLHEKISKEELGGASIHASKSGVVHHVSETEEECFEDVKKLLSYLPDNYRSLPQHNDFSYSLSEESIEQCIPENPNKAYDVRELIMSLVDDDSFFEIHKNFAPNILVGFGRLEGMYVGIVANQTYHKAGTLDIDASCKAARFIRTCNAFNISLLSLVDVPGFLPGIDQEHNGIIRHGAKLIYAYAEATVPKITLILRKAFGGAYIVMGSKHLGADFVYALPSAQIAVMGAESAISILHKKSLDAFENQEEKIQENYLLEEYKERYLHPFIAAQYGYIDAIIPPQKIRSHIIKALKITSQKVEHLLPRNQANCPL